MQILEWVRRLLTRLLSPAILRDPSLTDRKVRSVSETALPAAMCEHRDPKTDTAVMRLEDVRKDAQKARDEAKAACDEVKKASV